MRPPTVTDALAARQVVGRHLPPTPVWSYPALDRATGARLSVKLENTQPTGAFKVRGGINLLSRLTEAERRAGVVVFSTGNHGQSIAYAARLVGVPCCVVMPHPANPSKVLAMRALDATVQVHGESLEDARDHAELLAERDGKRLVHPANEPLLIAGVATLYLELLEAQPDLDAVFVPVGGGSGAAAACLVTSAVAPDCDVVAVQSSASPAAYESFHAGSCLTRPNRTVVEGLATGQAYELTQSMLRGRLARFLLVTDAKIRQAQHLLLTHARILAEGAGATALAGLRADPARYAGKRVGIVVTGGNASPEEVRAVLDSTDGNGP